jgi:hypothetical protein
MKNVSSLDQIVLPMSGDNNIPLESHSTPMEPTDFGSIAGAQKTLQARRNLPLLLPYSSLTSPMPAWTTPVLQGASRQSRSLVTQPTAAAGPKNQSSSPVSRSKRRRSKTPPFPGCRQIELALAETDSQKAKRSKYTTAEFQNRKEVTKVGGACFLCRFRKHKVCP